jgi:hypothetical protein
VQQQCDVVRCNNKQGEAKKWHNKEMQQGKATKHDKKATQQVKITRQCNKVK